MQCKYNTPTGYLTLLDKNNNTEFYRYILVSVSRKRMGVMQMEHISRLKK